MKNKRLLFGIIAIALAFLLVFVGIPIINRQYNRTVQVLRVTSNIEKGTVIDASQLTSVTVNASGMPDGVLSDPAEVLGKYAIVGASAVVTHDVGDYEVVVGNPARVIKTLDAERFE